MTDPQQPTISATWDQAEDGSYTASVRVSGIASEEQAKADLQRMRGALSERQQGLPPLPKVGPIGYASVVDILAYAPFLRIGPHLPGVRDAALWTTDQMRAYAAEAVARALAEQSSAWTMERRRLDIRICGQRREIERLSVNANSSAINAAIQEGRRQALAASAPSREVPGWISIEDRLPDKNVEVLIAFQALDLPSTGQYTGSPRDHDGWCYPSENRGTAADGSDPSVTHWMPLPAAPSTPVAAEETSHGS